MGNRAPILNDIKRLQEFYGERGSGHLIGKKVKLTTHWDSPVMVCDYVYYGVLLGETDLTWVALTGYTKVTLMKKNTHIEAWEG
jgi:hypothetical protein